MATTNMTFRSVNRSTPREDLLTVAGATWMIIGLFIDGYAHQNLLDDEESFFTIYHAVFYSGFAASSLAICRIALERARADLPFHRWLPPGYQAAAAGLVLFGAGGIGDGLWHSFFGIEKGIDALLSPTHIMLFAGALLIVSAPLRSAMARPGGQVSWPTLGSAIISMTVTLSLIGFLCAYMWGLGFAAESRTVYDPVTGAGEDALIVGVASAIISTAILFGGLGLMLRRWRLPMGAAALILIVPNAMVIGAFDYDGQGITAMFGAALLAEIMLAKAEPGRWWPTARYALMVVPAVLWLAVFALRASFDTVAWQAELWTGTVVMCALTGGAIALFLDPPELVAAD
jgi:hypothetical protein